MRSGWLGLFVTVQLMALGCGKARSPEPLGGTNTSDPERVSVPTDVAEPGADTDGTALGMPGDGEPVASDEPTADADPSSERRCRPDEVYLSVQADVDRVAGCEELAFVSVGAGLDLTPLSGLRRVRQLFLTGTTNLAGLEGLEEATGMLSLIQVPPEAMRSLRGLKRVGRLGIASPDMTQLVGFDALESAETISIAGSPRLESLAGLPLPPDLRFIELVDLPRLTDMSRLREYTPRDGFRFSGLPLETLDVFASLPSALKDVEIELNLNLRDVGALAGLESIVWLRIAGNPLLESLPDFDALTTLSALIVSDNPRLRRMPRFPGITTLFVDGYAGSGLDITNNAALEEATGFPALASAGSVWFEDNPNLTRLELPALTQVTESLRISHNLRLDPSTLSSLEALPASVHKIAGNGGSEPLLDPCPWQGDYFCDEQDRLCAPGTDVPDCPPVP